MSPEETLYRALAEDIGIQVRTSDPARAKAKLYAARKADPDLAELSICVSRHDPCVLLVMKRSALDAT